MKLIPAPDHHENQIFQRLVSEDGKIEMGIYPVMFGFRVRAGYVGDYGVLMDWCGGANQGQVELLYSIAKNILEHRGSFTGVPERSDIKPFFNDPAFLEKIYSLVTMPLEIVKLEPLNVTHRKILFEQFELCKPKQQ